MAMGRPTTVTVMREEAQVEVLAMHDELAAHDRRETVALASLATDIDAVLAVLAGSPRAVDLERARRRLATCATVVAQLRRWDVGENRAHRSFVAAAFALAGAGELVASAGVA